MKKIEVHTNEGDYPDLYLKGEYRLLFDDLIDLLKRLQQEEMYFEVKESLMPSSQNCIGIKRIYKYGYSADFEVVYSTFPNITIGEKISICNKFFKQATGLLSNLLCKNHYFIIIYHAKKN